MLRSLPLLFVLAACGASSGGTSGSGGAGGGGGGGSGGDCSGVLVRLGADGKDFKALHDGDTVQWQRGPQGCCHIWTGMLARGFADEDRVVYSFHVFNGDGTDWSSGQGFCDKFDNLQSAAGWRVDTCEKDRMDSMTLGLPGDGPVKVRVTIRDGITYDPSSPFPCTLADVPHCEASAEVTVNALAPPPDTEPPAPCAP